MVISTPNTAMLKQSTKARAPKESTWVVRISPRAPMANPTAAGIRREPTCRPLLYSSVTSAPEVQCATIPNTSGMEA